MALDQTELKHASKIQDDTPDSINITGEPVLHPVTEFLTALAKMCESLAGRRSEHDANCRETFTKAPKCPLVTGNSRNGTACSHGQHRKRMMQ